MQYTIYPRKKRRCNYYIALTTLLILNIIMLWKPESLIAMIGLLSVTFIIITGLFYYAAFQVANELKMREDEAYITMIKNDRIIRKVKVIKDKRGKNI